MKKLKALIAEATKVTEAEDELIFIDLRFVGGRKTSLSYGGRKARTDLTVVGNIEHNAELIVDDKLVADLQKALAYKKAHGGK